MLLLLLLLFVFCFAFFRRYIMFRLTFFRERNSHSCSIQWKLNKGNWFWVCLPIFLFVPSRYFFSDVLFTCSWNLLPAHSCSVSRSIVSSLSFSLYFFLTHFLCHHAFFLLNSWSLHLPFFWYPFLKICCFASKQSLWQCINICFECFILCTNVLLATTSKGAYYEET